MHHLDGAAGEPESHGVERAVADPVRESVDFGSGGRDVSYFCAYLWKGK